MPESPPAPTSKWSKIRLRFRTTLVWWMHRRRLGALALLMVLAADAAGSHGVRITRVVGVGIGRPEWCRRDRACGIDCAGGDGSSRSNCRAGYIGRQEARTRISRAIVARTRAIRITRAIIAAVVSAVVHGFALGGPVCPVGRAIVSPVAIPVAFMSPCRGGRSGDGEDSKTNKDAFLHAQFL